MKKAKERAVEDLETDSDSELESETEVEVDMEGGGDDRSTSSGVSGSSGAE